MVLAFRPRRFSIGSEGTLRIAVGPEASDLGVEIGIAADLADSRWRVRWRLAFAVRHAGLGIEKTWSDDAQYLLVDFHRTFPFGLGVAGGGRGEGAVSVNAGDVDESFDRAGMLSKDVLK